MAITEHEQDTSPYVGRRMTLDEFLELPEQEPPLEFDAGVVTQKMSPDFDHSAAAEIFLIEMNRVGVSGRLGRAYVEGRCRGMTASFVPDVAYYRRGRLQVRDGRRFARLQDPPDIAVEILSPGQSVIGLMKKCLRYLELGTAVAILVDPGDEAVLMFRPGEPMRVLQGDDRIDLDDVLPGFDLTPRRVFDSIVPSWWLSDEDPGDTPPGSP
jgi:Uma2 family endonuclease